MLPLYYNDGGGSALLSAGFFLVGLFFLAIVYVAGSFLLMKLFDKAGVQGKWRAWVPLYNLMVFSKLGDLSPWLVLILGIASAVPGLNFIAAPAMSVVLVMAAYRIGLKLQKEAIWAVLYFFLSLIWLGILAFDRSRWNTAIAPAPWAQSFLGDKTVWDGIPVQTTTIAQGYTQTPGYPSAPGYPTAPPAGYQPPPAGYQTAPPAGYQPPPAGYQPPPAPPAGYQPPAAPPAAPPAGYQPPAVQQPPVSYDPPVAPEDPTQPRP